MITYVTPSGSSTLGGPVDAMATFTTSANTLSIVLTNLQANPTDVAQLLSDLSFTVGNGGTLTGATLASSSAQEITVAADGSFTLGSAVATGWVPTLSGTSGSLDDLAAGGAGPTHLIIGPPGPGGTDSNANGSIAGNKAHNPFLNNFATFSISGSGITADTTITSATFSFGTTSGIDVTGVSAGPEPSSAVLAGIGVGILSLIALRRRRTQLRTADG
jgi:MYXO-CTERM domain-containing protein